MVMILLTLSMGSIPALAGGNGESYADMIERNRRENARARMERAEYEAERAKAESAESAKRAERECKARHDELIRYIQQSPLCSADDEKSNKKFVYVMCDLGKSVYLRGLRIPIKNFASLPNQSSDTLKAELTKNLASTSECKEKLSVDSLTEYLPQRKTGVSQ
jgi:hypothetical protein